MYLPFLPHSLQLTWCHWYSGPIIFWRIEPGSLWTVLQKGRLNLALDKTIIYWSWTENYFWSFFLKGMEKILVTRLMATFYGSETVLICSSKDTIISTEVATGVITWVYRSPLSISRDPPVCLFVFDRSLTCNLNIGYESTHEYTRLSTNVVAILAHWETNVPVQRLRNQYNNSANYQICPFQFHIGYHINHYVVCPLA